MTKLSRFITHPLSVMVYAPSIPMAGGAAAMITAAKRGANGIVGTLAALGTTFPVLAATTTLAFRIARKNNNAARRNYGSPPIP